jgi:DNA-binding CsgD family transcriptional regulator
LLATAIGRVGLIETWAQEITPGLLERGVAIEDSLDRPLLFHDSPKFISTIQLFDELDRCRDVAEALERDAMARGDEHARAWAVLQLIALEGSAGRWKRALEHGAVAIELAEQTGERQYAGMVCSCKAVVEADVGLVERARATAEHGLACAHEVGDEIYSAHNLGALGYVELGIGNVEQAAGRLRELPARLLAAGQRSPADVWPNAIEALIARGELEQARSYLEQYEPLARHGGRWARATTARCRGLLTAAEGNPTATLGALERSRAELEDKRYPLALARTLLALGSVHRQAKHKRHARDALDRALAIFEELGAPLWAEKARAELRRISGRRPASDELSETEERVAALATDGRSNKQIAAELYTSVRTVEAHLSHIYRKLGVRSRAELTRRLTTAERSAKPAGQAAKEQ